MLAVAVVVLLVVQPQMAALVAVVEEAAQVVAQRLVHLALAAAEAAVAASRMMHKGAARGLLSFDMLILSQRQYLLQVRLQLLSLAGTEFTDGHHLVQSHGKEKKCRTLQKLRMELLRK